jgi:hypothetical protein
VNEQRTISSSWWRFFQGLLLAVLIVPMILNQNRAFEYISRTEKRVFEIEQRLSRVEERIHRIEKYLEIGEPPQDLPIPPLPHREKPTVKKSEKERGLSRNE